MIRRFRLLPLCGFALVGALIACLAPLAAAEPAGAGASDPPPIQLDAEHSQSQEDRIEALAPAEQGPALLELRRQVSASNLPAAQIILQRLNLKLAYAAAQVKLSATSTDLAYADRLLLSKQAAEIGANFLKQNDPARALTWEARSRARAAESLWPDDLRNQIHAWYERRLTAAVDANHWPEAQTEIAAWRKAMGADSAVSEGVSLYAQARADDLTQALGSTDPRTVLSRLTAEETANPGAAAWLQVRDHVAVALDHDFQRTVANRDIDGARSALELQTAIAAEYRFDDQHAPLAANNRQFDALVRALQPNPIQRQFGQVHAVQFRIEVMEAAGALHFRHAGIDLKAFGYFPYAVGDWRIYQDETNPTWFGFNMTGQQASYTKDFQSGSRFQVQAFFLLGHRAEKWSGSLGLGLVYNFLFFQDGKTLTRNSSLNIAVGLRGDYEQIVAEKWTVYGTAILAAGNGSNMVEIKTGARYYFNHNFSVGAHAMLSNLAVAREGIAGPYHVDELTLGPSMMMQF